MKTAFPPRLREIRIGACSTSSVSEVIESRLAEHPEHIKPDKGREPQRDQPASHFGETKARAVRGTGPFIAA
jgi:hypothetical protein